MWKYLRKEFIIMFIADFQMIQLFNKKCVCVCVRAREGVNERKREWRKKSNVAIC